MGFKKMLQMNLFIIQNRSRFIDAEKSMVTWNKGLERNILEDWDVHILNTIYKTNN